MTLLLKKWLIQDQVLFNSEFLDGLKVPDEVNFEDN